MASVFLDFVPLDKDDLIKLHIYEAPAQAGPFTLIESVTAIGTAPDYITEWTTNLAASDTDWFAIRWEDDKGWMSEISIPIKGGERTVVGEVLDRVMERRPSANERVALNVTEAVVESVFQIDPYTVDYDIVTYRQFEGMAMLTLAFLTQTEISQGTTNRYTAGLVSEDTGTSQQTSDVTDLFNLAYRWLGISQSRIGQMQEFVMSQSLFEIDQSRLLLSEIP